VEARGNVNSEDQVQILGISGSIRREARPVRASIEGYILGNSAQEQKRLRLQATFLEKWTEQFLLSAGLKPGMRVLVARMDAEAVAESDFRPSAIRGLEPEALRTLFCSRWPCG
jgi:hypothetical protein